MSGATGGAVGGPILALDASAAACSVALVRGGQILAWREAPMDRGHAEALMPLVMESMRRGRDRFRRSGEDRRRSGARAVSPAFALRWPPRAASGLQPGARLSASTASTPSLRQFRQAKSPAAPCWWSSNRSERNCLANTLTRRCEYWANLWCCRPKPCCTIARRVRCCLPATARPACRPAPIRCVRAAPAGPMHARSRAWRKKGRAIVAARPLYLRPADVTLPKPRGERGQ